MIAEKFYLKLKKTCWIFRTIFLEYFTQIIFFCSSRSIFHWLNDWRGNEKWAFSLFQYSRLTIAGKLFFSSETQSLIFNIFSLLLLVSYPRMTTRWKQQVVFSFEKEFRQRKIERNLLVDKTCEGIEKSLCWSNSFCQLNFRRVGGKTRKINNFVAVLIQLDIWLIKWENLIKKFEVDSSNCDLRMKWFQVKECSEKSKNKI